VCATVPLDYVDGMNVYAYVNGNTTNGVDPMGLADPRNPNIWGPWIQQHAPTGPESPESIEALDGVSPKVQNRINYMSFRFKIPKEKIRAVPLTPRWPWTNHQPFWVYSTVYNDWYEDTNEDGVKVWRRPGTTNPAFLVWSPVSTPVVSERSDALATGVYKGAGVVVGTTALAPVAAVVIPEACVPWLAAGGLMVVTYDASSKIGYAIPVLEDANATPDQLDQAGFGLTVASGEVVGVLYAGAKGALSLAAGRQRFPLTLGGEGAGASGRFVLLNPTTEADLIAATANVKPLPGVFDLAVHCNGQVFSDSVVAAEGTEYTARQLAAVLAKEGYRGGPLRLISCTSASLGQDLADELVPLAFRDPVVYAPTDLVWARGGELLIQPGFKVPLKRALIALPLPPGRWIGFKPSKPTLP